MGAWGILAFCIVAEVSATSLLTRSEGFARPVYGLLALVILGGCFWALSQVLTPIPMGELSRSPARAGRWGIAIGAPRCSLNLADRVSAPHI